MDNLLEALKTGSAFQVNRGERKEGGRRRTPRAAGGQWRHRWCGAGRGHWRRVTMDIEVKNVRPELCGQQRPPPPQSLIHICMYPPPLPPHPLASLTHPNLRSTDYVTAIEWFLELVGSTDDSIRWVLRVGLPSLEQTFIIYEYIGTTNTVTLLRFTSYLWLSHVSLLLYIYTSEAKIQGILIWKSLLSGWFAASVC